MCLCDLFIWVHLSRSHCLNFGGLTERIHCWFKRQKNIAGLPIWIHGVHKKFQKEFRLSYWNCIAIIGVHWSAETAKLTVTRIFGPEFHMNNSYFSGALMSKRGLHHSFLHNYKSKWFRWWDNLFHFFSKIRQISVILRVKTYFFVQPYRLTRKGHPDHVNVPAMVSCCTRRPWPEQPKGATWSGLTAPFLGWPGDADRGRPSEDWLPKSHEKASINFCNQFF
jgi:hypothetical protein